MFAALLLMLYGYSAALPVAPYDPAFYDVDTEGEIYSPEM